MKVFVKSFLFILIIILTLLTKGTLERILYLISGILLYLIISKQRSNQPREYKKIISGLIIGYLIGNMILINSKYEIVYEKLRNNNINANKNAVILLFDVDAPTYNPRILIKNFVDTKRVFDFYKLPLDLYKSKVLSEKFGGNMNSYYTQLMVQKLQSNLKNEYTVYESYINQSPYIDEVIKQAINEGNGQIIIMPLSLVESKNIEAYHSIIQSTKFQIENVKFKYINYLWDSELMVASHVEKINASIQVADKSRAGVILVGEMFNKKAINEIYLKQDVLFREKISSLLKKHGYDHNKVRLSFSNKRLIKEEMERLMEYGVGQIIIVHISNESQKNSSLEMTQSLVKSLEAPQSIQFMQIYGWTPDEYVIEELLKRIELSKYKSDK